MRRLSFEFTKAIYNDSVKKYMWFGKLLLEMLCAWPSKEGLFKRAIGWLFFCNLAVVEIFHAAYCAQNYSNIGDAVMVGATVTTTLEAMVRFYIMLSKREIINKILTKVWKKFWPVEVLDPVKRKKIQNKAKFRFWLNLIFFSSSLISSTNVNLAPYLSDNELIFKSSFPFDWNKPYVYEFLYVWQYFSNELVVFMINAFDFFFMSLVCICTIQYIIMQEVFANILSKDSRRHRQVIFGDRGKHMTDKEMLKKCLEQHEMLIEICNELDNSFNRAILIQFVVNTAANCAAFVTLKFDRSQFTKMLTYAVAHLSQLFYYCLAGQDLQYESQRLSDFIYDSDWQSSYNRDFRKSIVLMIQRSQKPQCLTALGLVNLDFLSFVQIMRLSFSFYTLLDGFLADE
uniref:Odorant receptor n=1 Tax=Holotrichia oblita TaxID=644536 RepID=A0A8F6LBV8_HOLOL|nr:Or1 [Holotrichia oblita]